MLRGVSTASSFEWIVHTVIAQLPLIEHAGSTLVSHVRNPNTTNPDTLGLQPLIEFVPQWLVQLLYTPVNETPISSHQPSTNKPWGTHWHAPQSP